jgi:protein-S-isoprenylcysteine O-methyltransferase Ste14
MHRLELKVPPLALFLACALLILALAALQVATLAAVPGRWTAGVLLIAAGVLVAVLGVAEFRRARTTVNPMSPERASNVVTSGVYRWSRNPMYLGMATVLAGLSLAAGSGAGLLVTLGFCVYLNRFQIVPEERRLLEAFGEPYARYLREVRRWL